MGLDMYLYADLYYSIKGGKGNEILDYLKLTDKGDPNSGHGITVSVPVAYWRKANQIHNYFININKERIKDTSAFLQSNLNDKELDYIADDCSPISIGREDLEELVIRCKKVIEYIPQLQLISSGNFGDLDTNTIDDINLLPTKSGFFFGSTNYDEHYKKDLEITILKLEKVLNDFPEKMDDCYVSFTYKASW
jgi:hypothetical protein